jgi:uncharacterized protein YfdQ (DUF2303 family)
MPNENQNENIAETVLRIASQPFEIAGQVALPYGWKLEDAESVLDVPRRKRATVSLADTDGFIAYLKRHGSLSSATIWCEADYQKGVVAFMGIINDHGETEGSQQWRDHTAKLVPTKSVEWQRWNGFDRKIMSQLEFAAFIEDNLGDIASAEGFPTGTAMLQMATCMEIAQDSTIKSAIRLQSGGVRMEYVEDSNAETVKSMEVFSKFALGLPVFWGGAAYQVEARLKYRLNAGKLSFWYELNRPDKVLEDAAKTLTTTIQSATGFPLFHGNPFVK